MRFMHWDRHQLGACTRGHFLEIVAMMNEQGRAGSPSEDPVTMIG